MCWEMKEIRFSGSARSQRKREKRLQRRQPVFLLCSLTSINEERKATKKEKISLCFLVPGRR